MFATRDGRDSPVADHTSAAERQFPPMTSLGEHEASVTQFTKRNGLEDHLDVFRNAALLLQVQAAPEELASLTDYELQALQSETSQPWRQPWALYFTIIMCSVGAVEQGMAQTSMNGANLYFPVELGIGSDSPHDTLVVGLINSGIYLSVGCFGAWLSDPINNRLGRRGAILCASCICIVGNIASALSRSWEMLLVCRLILGIALGLDAATINVYAAECAPAYIRGGLAVSWQMFTAFGLLLGFIANIAVFNVESPWRWQLAFPAIPVVLLAALIMLCPESPAWLIKRTQDYPQAFDSLRRLRNTEVQAAKELYANYLQHSSDSDVELHRSFYRKLFELFTVPRVRRAALAAFVVMLSQQLCGINITAFYSSTIFVNAGFSTFQALLASTVFGLVNFIGAFPAVWTMDRLGRRSLLLVTLPFMALTMLGAGLTFSLPKENPARLGLLAAMIYLFCAEYSPGMGPVPAPYSAEVFPISHRDIGMSFAVSVAFTWAAILSLTFPRILAVLHPQGAFTLYAVLNVLAFVLVYLFVPETRMKTLDELDHVFSVSTRRFISYNTTEYVPWLFRTYILREKDAQLSPLAERDGYQPLSQDEGD